MTQGILIAWQHPVSGPICVARNHLPIPPWHLKITPGLRNCGTKWQFSGPFSSPCTLVYAGGFEAAIAQVQTS